MVGGIGLTCFLLCKLLVGSIAERSDMILLYGLIQLSLGGLILLSLGGLT